MKNERVRNRVRNQLKYYVLLLFSLLVFGFAYDNKLSTNTTVQSPTPNTVTEKHSISSFYNVRRVIDGDTIEVEIGGKVERVRLIGIDSPETVDPRIPVQCFGSEASNKAKELMRGKNVRLESDPTQGDRDKYNRLLRYVFLKDGTFINNVMISEGFAHEFTYLIPYRYQMQFRSAEDEARRRKRGLWGDGMCITPSPTKSRVRVPDPTDSPTSH